MTSAAVKTANILVLPGDGVGPEIIREAVLILELIEELQPSLKFKLSEAALGGASIDKHGVPVTDEVIAEGLDADAVLLGSVGGPQWDTQSDGTLRPEWGILRLRKSLDAFANIRPCSFPSESLVDASPLKREIAVGTDFIVLRENVSGIYFGAKKEDNGSFASDECHYTSEEVARVTRIAAKLAQTRTPPSPLHLVDKANVMASSRIWRRVAYETHAKEFPHLSLDHHLVDSVSALMIKNPRALNGIVFTENLFGDILSDESSVIVGSLGLLPSAELSSTPNSFESVGGVKGIYQPVHGSAPDIAGKGIANPIAMILSTAFMLRYSFGEDGLAKKIEDAVRAVLDGGLRTGDLGGKAGTKDAGDAIREELRKALKA